MDTRKVETCALSDDQLDAVAGGFSSLPLRAFTKVEAGQAVAEGGQSDPAQMLQQILQQLTQGQG